MADPNQDAMRTTDLSPPSKKIIKQVPVKIEILRGGTQARITPKDPKEFEPMIVPAFTIAKRLSDAEKKAGVAFFMGAIGSTVGALEIGDRLPEGKRW